MAKQTEETKAINAYIAELNKHYRKGKATEHTYRPALERLIETLAPGVTATNEPRRIECGAPDYVVERNNKPDIPIGYIEAKDIGIDLGSRIHKEQFDRYRHSLDNFIITDYLIFQLFVSGELITTATIAKPNKSGIEADSSQFEAFFALISKFIGHDGQKIRTAENLSKKMAAKAKALADAAEKALNRYDMNEDNPNGTTSTIYGQLQGIRDILIADIPVKEFAGIFAQTIAYGLFAAKLNGDPASILTRQTAAERITPSNPFLQNFFQYVTGTGLDNGIKWMVDDLADLFNHVDINAIMDEFNKIEHDPMIHFYETFLTEYDPEERKSRGAWYTPQPVVQFIVRSVDEVLKQEFNLSTGLADESTITLTQKDDHGKMVDKEYHKVQILDPATGTGTFLAEIVKHIHSQYKNQQGMWQSYATKHLIPRINGFEVQMTPYTMAHIKLDMILRQTGYKHPPNKRLRIYLTNSLHMTKTHEADDPLARLLPWFINEANEAIKIKRDVPLMVVIGNPPYSGESQNKGARVEWVSTLLDAYKREPTGEALDEKNPKWLNDDYVKFIRYGQYFVERNGAGILAYITNHSFLDNPTFRGMRYNLLKTFDKIYILDLHGNAKKKETAPDGSKDENVFAIQQGVSINLFVKTGHKAKNKLAEVFHCDLYGKREEKFKFLQKNSLKSLKWRKIELRAPQYLFAVKDFSHIEEYERGFKIQELFPVNSVGIVTAKDAVFVNTDKKTLLKNIQNSFDTAPNKKLIHPVDYRPFDSQYIYYDTDLVERSREKVMQHFLNGENVGLMVCRQQKTDGFYHCLIHEHIVESSLVSNKTSEIGSSFPLYLYDGKQRRPNIGNDAAILKKAADSEAIITEIAHKTGLHYIKEKDSNIKKAFAPIDILDYIYAVLHSPTYREKYKGFLKTGFPRIPYPEDAKSFRRLANIGTALRQLHLMVDIIPPKNLANFPVAGSDEVDAIRYTDQKVYINAEQYFNRVPTEAWDFYIGSYQPAQWWLKSRRGQSLESGDIAHYQKIIFVLRETAKIMQAIDLPE